VKKIYILILKSYSGPLIMTFFIALFVLLMQFLWKYVDDLVGKGLSWDIIMQLMFYASATFVPLALPLAILLSSLMTFGNLGERYELVAIKAAGISLSKVMMPLVVLSFLISVGAFYFSNIVLPLANLKFTSILYDVRQKKLSLNIKEGEYYNGIDGYVIRVLKKEKDEKTIRKVMLYDHTSGLGNSTLTIADSGIMVTTPDKKYLDITLYNGYNFDERGGRSSLSTRPFQRTKFAEENHRFDLSAFSLNRTNKELFKSNFQMLNLKQLTHAQDSLINDLNKQKEFLNKNLLSVFHYFSVYDTLKRNFPDTSKPLNQDFLLSFTKAEQSRILDFALNDARVVKSGLEFNKGAIESREIVIRRHQIEWHRKFTLSFACFILFFIGAPFGAIIRKGGLGLPLVISVILFVLYHVISMTGEKSVRAGAIPAYEGMWLASAILLPVGILLTLKATTDSALFDTEIWKRLYYKYFKK